MILMIFMFLMNVSSFSLQFAVLMWILTYVGALFNGLTLLILGKETGTCSDMKLLFPMVLRISH